MDDAPRDHTATEQALIASAFAQIAERGWARLSIVDAARAADIPLDVARQLLPDRCALLRRFGRWADTHALQDAGDIGTPRDRLFDVLMRRIDMLHRHRPGVLALLHALPMDPASAVLLASASLNSMRWMLEAAGISASGPLGALRAKGLLAVWLWTLRAWQRDTTDDLAPTMAALDQALARAENAATWLGSRVTPATPPASIPPTAPAEEGPSDAD